MASSWSFIFQRNDKILVLTDQVPTLCVKNTDKIHNIHITAIIRRASSFPCVPTKMNCYLSHNYEQYSPTSNNCISHHHRHKHQGLDPLWSVPSPQLQLLAPTLLRSSNCFPFLWSVVVWFQRFCGILCKWWSQFHLYSAKNWPGRDNTVTNPELSGGQKPSIK